MDDEAKKKLIAFWLLEINKFMREDDFQKGFVKSLQEQFLKKNTLSDKQIAALGKVYVRVTEQK